MHLAIILGAAALVLAGCQTAEQSMANADSVCHRNRPEARHEDLRALHATPATATTWPSRTRRRARWRSGAAVGVIGGAAIGARGPSVAIIAAGAAGKRPSQLYKGPPCAICREALACRAGIGDAGRLARSALAYGKASVRRSAATFRTSSMTRPSSSSSSRNSPRTSAWWPAPWRISGCRTAARLAAQRLAQEGRAFGGLRRDPCAGGREALRQRPRGHRRPELRLRHHGPRARADEAGLRARCGHGGGAGARSGRGRASASCSGASGPGSRTTRSRSPTPSSPFRSIRNSPRSTSPRRCCSSPMNGTSSPRAARCPSTASPRSPPAPREMVASFFDYLESELDAVNFYPPGQAADHGPQHAGHLPPSRDDRAGGPHPARGDSRPCGRAHG